MKKKKFNAIEWPLLQENLMYLMTSLTKDITFCKNCDTITFLQRHGLYDILILF